MSKHQEMVRNPKTGQLEPKQYETHRPSSNSGPDSVGVSSINAHYRARAAVEARQQELINAESKRQQEIAQRQAEVKAQQQREQAIRDEKARVQQREDRERIKQQNDSNLAKAIKATSQLRRGYRA